MGLAADFRNLDFDGFLLSVAPWGFDGRRNAPTWWRSIFDGAETVYFLLKAQIKKHDFSEKYPCVFSSFYKTTSAVFSPPGLGSHGKGSRMM